MSNHIHLIISAAQGSNLSDTIRDFKRHTSKQIRSEILTNSKESRQEWMLRLMKYFAKYNSNNEKFQLWQRGKHPIELISLKWIKQELDYIHINPVRAGIVEYAEDYLYSSAKYYYKDEKPIIPLIKLDADYNYN